MYTFSKPDTCKVSEMIKQHFMVHVLKLNYSEVTPIMDIDLTSPIIFLLGGVGGSGKSTFVDMCKSKIEGVYELSTIDCCKSIVDHMLSIEKDLESSQFDGQVPLLNKHVEEKSDEYRTLLHKLKSAWSEIDDGPNRIMVNQVKNLIDTDESVSVIFINVREPEQIYQLKRMLEYSLPCAVFTLVITRVPAQTFTNDGDRRTLEYPYDIQIINRKDLDHLDKIAEEFCDAVLAIKQLVQYSEQYLEEN